MTLLRLAVRNLRGAGIRTWLNAMALSFAFVAIIFGQGMLQGMNKQAETSSIAFEFGGGQYWQESYDPFDPLTLDDAHAPLPPSIESLAAARKAAPVLIVAGSIYPQGRIKPVLIKGIDPTQKVLAMPTRALADESEPLPMLIGSRTAAATGLVKGDNVTVQWRDADGTFDARDGRIVEVMNTTVLTVDQGQVWVPLDTLRRLAGLPGQATLVTIARGLGRAGHDRIALNSDRVPNGAGWKFHSDNDLLADLHQIVASKTIGQSIMFTVLFLLAMLAIFDTQVLSIFRRRREIGMLIALGMTKAQVIVLFTLEGAFHSILAAILGLLYAGPLFFYLGRSGFAIPGAGSWGIAIGDRLYPTFTAGLVLGTTVLVFVVTAFVAWLPTRRIAKLKPTDALAGRGT
jgi:putative ABC transport system permease protein